ncbi:MAG: LptF/LptG family permease [Phycisphaeraceae bacterium]|nr:LptF/LptG family permease [Phycisphaeraceae bacterium]
MRIPGTLWRHMAIEVGRVVLITAAVLLCVVSFSAVVKFLAEGKLSPLDALRFMGVIAVPMLHYTLPFASGFGATLAYHRMVSDGEILAAHAGGIGHRAVLMPALLAAIGLGGGLAFLNQQVIPKMLESSHRMITQDIAKILSASIESSQSVNFDNFLLHAGSVKRFGADTSSGASERMMLTDVVAVEFDRKGVIRSEATARRAWLWVFPPGGPDPMPGVSPGVGYVRMRLEEGVGFSGGQLVRFTELSPDPWLLPDSFRTDPKFFSNSEMDTLRERPELMHGVEQRRVRLAQRLAERQTMGEIKTSLLNTQRVRLVDGTGQTLILRASDVRLTPERRWAVLPTTPGRPIEVDRFMPDGSLARYGARSAEIVTQTIDLEGMSELTARLVLSEVTTISGTATGSSVGGSVGGDRAQLSLGPLYSSSRPLDDLIGRSCAELLEASRAYTNRDRPDLFIEEAASDLAKSIAKLEREILSKVHERWAMSAACLVMALAGAATAMRLGNALPLAVYLWSFIPALAAVITITSGQQLTHDLGAPGLFVLWGGVGLLVVYTLVSYFHVARH